MTDAERDALLIDIATALGIMAGRELGMKGATPASNDLLRSTVEKLDAFVSAQRTRGISDPHDLLRGR